MAFDCSVPNVAKINCIDLFCGLGGLTHGLLQSGINVVAGVDLDPTCMHSYKTNNDTPFIKSDVTKLDKEMLLPLFGNSGYRMLAGCAPCQPFSTYSQKHPGRFNGKDWSLLLEFARLINDIKPDFVTMENVPRLKDCDVFEVFLNSLSDYQVSYQIVDCASYGIPQTRKRLVLLASSLGCISLPKPESFNCRPKTVRDMLANLRPLEAGTQDPTDIMHKSSSLSSINLKRIRASKPGGTWRDWSEDLRAACHRKKTGETFPSVYGRMEWDKPAPTITTQFFGFGNGRFGHPEQDRALSLREAAILQTFPEDYEFLAPGESPSFKKFGRLIGNAVPVKLGKIIGQTFLHHTKKVNALEALNDLSYER